MGIIKAAVNSVKGALGDQWLKAIEPVEMSDSDGVCQKRIVSPKWEKILLPTVL